jgi:hypothetical protein
VIEALAVQPHARSWAPWVTVGASAVLAGVGIGFGVLSHRDSDRLTDVPHNNADFVDLESRLHREADTANVFFASAAITFAAGVVLGIVLN